MTSEVDRCYRALELEPGASLGEVKEGWRELVKVWHPDRFPNDAKLQRKAQERLKEINHSYEILEQYLTSNTPPPRGRPTSSQSSETHRSEAGQGPDSQKARTESSPPPQREKQSPSEPKELHTGRLWAVIVGVMVILLIIMANSGGDPNRTPSPRLSKTLDEKNGFKEFKFGMTLEDVRQVLSPSTVTDQPRTNMTVFNYLVFNY